MGAHSNKFGFINMQRQEVIRKMYLDMTSYKSPLPAEAKAIKSPVD